MVVNTRYRFVFVHIPKSAGTSIMNSLSSLPGNASHWLASTKHETLAEFEQAVASRRSLLDRLLGRSPQGFFRFAFVRNPWDRMASIYRYLVEHRPRPEIDGVSSFKDFLRQARDGVAWIRSLYSMKPQVDYFTTDDGMLRIDFLGHFEHLGEDLEAIARRLGVSVQLPHLNQSSNHRRDYRREYDSEMIDIVADYFAEVIGHFGYDFHRRYPTRRCSDRLERPRDILLRAAC